MREWVAVVMVLEEAARERAVAEMEVAGKGKAVGGKEKAVAEMEVAEMVMEAVAHWDRRHCCKNTSDDSLPCRSRRSTLMKSSTGWTGCGRTQGELWWVHISHSTLMRGRRHTCEELVAAARAVARGRVAPTATAAAAKERERERARVTAGEAAAMAAAMLAAVAAGGGGLPHTARQCPPRCLAR